MARLEILLLGSPLVRLDGRLIKFARRKSLALLAYLAVSGGPHGRDVLAELLWPEHYATESRASLRRTLSTLNELGFAPWLDAGRDAIGLAAAGDVWVDAAAFTEAAAGRQPDTLEAALALYRGDFLAGFSLKDSAAFDTWQTVQAQSLQQQYLSVCERLAQHHTRAGLHEQAVMVLQRWVTLDPLHETAQTQLIEAFAAAGQRTAALTQYQRYAETLDAELGVPPGIDLQRLVQRIRTEQPAGRPRHAPGSLPPVPALLVGRDDALTTLKARLTPHAEDDGSRRVVVQGWPGIGKTTLTAALAHQPDIQEQFSDGILWTSLGQHPNLLAVLTAWARAIGLYELENAQSVDEASARLTAHLRDRQMLLIIDDVWAVDHAAPLQVGGARSRTLATTRLNDVARALADGPDAIYKIPILQPEASLALLEMLAPEIVARHRREAMELAADLEGLPLALQVAGRLLHAEYSLGWGVADLLSEIRGGRLLDAPSPADRAELALETTPTIAALLRRSVEHLPEDMRAKFALLGVFAPKPATFTLGALSAVWDTDDPRAAVRLFVDRGLLEPAQAGHFQMHALLVMLAKSMVEGLH